MESKTVEIDVMIKMEEHFRTESRMFCRFWHQWREDKHIDIHDCYVRRKDSKKRIDNLYTLEKWMIFLFTLCCFAVIIGFISAGAYYGNQSMSILGISLIVPLTAISGTCMWYINKIKNKYHDIMAADHKHLSEFLIAYDEKAQTRPLVA